MNITDNIIDKVIYKEFGSGTGGQRISLSSSVENLSGDTKLIEALARVGGTLNLQARFGNTYTLLARDVILTVYVNDEIVYSQTISVPAGSYTGLITIPIDIKPFSKIKIMGNGSTSIDVDYVFLEGYLIDSPQMYLQEVVE